MISTNIDGTVGGANQLLDLLSLVANPTAYEDKLKTLQDATAENKKYVEALAPASEIVALRDAARIELENAKAEAAEIKAKAKASAQNVLAKANAEASSILAEADSIKEKAIELQKQATGEMAQAKSIQNTAEQNIAKANAAFSAAEAAKADAQQARVDANNAKAEYAALRQSLIDKHKAFIESL